MSRRKTAEQFIQEAIAKHGNDHYDYSKVDYKNCDANVIIMCKIHGDFTQTPYMHLKSKHCPRCRGHQKTTEQFINESIVIHGDRYDYSKVDYINSTTKIIIICKTHGEIEQMPSSHLSGQGCRKCGDNTLKTTKQFVEDAKNIFGEKYDYSRVDYKGAHKKVIIVCSEHGEFEIKPNCHLNGSGCYKCGRKQVGAKLAISKKGVLMSNLTIFTQKSNAIHGDKYDYSKVVYKGYDKKVIIICKEHGEFLQSPKCHLKGNGCFKCGIAQSSDRNRKPVEQFIKDAIAKHGDKYDYSKVESYNNNKQKLIIICKTHGEFQQNSNCHLGGQGCPSCVNKTEGKLREQMTPFYPTLLTQFKQDWCKKIRCLPFDFCIPDRKIIIELDGPQHFKQVMGWASQEDQLENDKYKEQCANEQGYSVIRLTQEDVYYDTYDWVTELCESIEEITACGEITNVYLCKNGEYDSY